MYITTLANAKRDFSILVNSCTEFDDVITIATDKGNVVMISEKEYKNLIESLFLANIKGVYDDVREVENTPTKAFIKESPFD